jgi:hypothetical protein
MAGPLIVAGIVGDKQIQKHFSPEGQDDHGKKIILLFSEAM